MYESGLILQYLEWRFPKTRLLPGDVDGMLAARRLEVLADGVCDAVGLTFFERMRADGTRSPEWLAKQRRKIDGGVREMARLLGVQSFAVGRKFGLGDIAIGTALGYLSVRFSEFDWRSQYPNLAAFNKRIETRPSFASTVPVPQKISDKVV